MKKTEVVQNLKNLIEQERVQVIQGPDQPLEMDSFAMTLLITSVKTTMGAELDPDKMDSGTIHSLNTLADLILAHYNEPAS